MIKVSIIVPVFNAQHTLHACLGNLLHQTIDEYELILVNDASWDESLEILQACKAQAPHRVHVIHSKVNRGPGGARNLGLQAAVGEYIGFVDSDDVVDVTMFEKLYKQAKLGDYDIVDSGFYNQKEDTAIIYTSDDLTGSLTEKKRNKLIASGGFIWSKLFRTRMIQEDQNLRFRENCILEDADFLTYAFATASSIGNVKEILYKYCYSKEQISQSNTTDPFEYHRSICEAMEGVYKKVSQLSGYSLIQASVEYELAQMYLYGVINALSNKENLTFDYKAKLNQLMALKKDMVHGSYEENEYILEKIRGEDYNLLKKF
jgi:glycosyltransferase involved in cell wall biosynthesis